MLFSAFGKTTQGIRRLNLSPTVARAFSDAKVNPVGQTQHHPKTNHDAKLLRELSIGAPRSTVMFRTDDEPGALENALRIFWKHNVNMTRIESKPSPKSRTKYDFIVDF